MSNYSMVLKYNYMIYIIHYKSKKLCRLSILKHVIVLQYHIIIYSLNENKSPITNQVIGQTPQISSLLRSCQFLNLQNNVIIG